jgi:hypothetical protein
MFAALKPMSTDFRFCSVRTNRPAPISNTTDTATCVISKPLLSQVREAATLRLCSFMALARSTRVARSAGINPNVSPVSMLMPATNASTCQSMVVFCPNGSSFLLQ